MKLRKYFCAAALMLTAVCMTGCAKEKAEDFVSYYMSQPTGDGFVTMDNVTNDLNKVFKKLAAPLTSIMNIDAVRQGIDL